MIGFNHLGKIGRLGNQMFQYAALRGIADKHGYDFTIPDSNFEDEWNEHQLFDVFKLPNLKNRGMIDAQYVQENQFHFNQELFDTCPDNVSIYGFFQTEKYFSHIADSIKEDFKFSGFLILPKMDFKAKLEKFVSWFKDLPEEDQDELMKMVYSEYKVRDVVRAFSTMPAVQRQTVFQRLGLPNELLTKIPAPGVNATGELEVEWQEWNGEQK